MFSGQNRLSVGNAESRTYFSYGTFLGIIVTEFLVSSVLLSYGIIYSELIQLNISSATDELWTPIILVAVWNIANPTARRICEYLDDNDYNHRTTIKASTLTFSFAIVLASCFSNSYFRAAVYGVVGGICSSIISSQIKITTYEDFQSRPMMFWALVQTSRASALFTVPHLLLFFVKKYGVFEAKFLFSAVLLNVIPAGFIIKKKKLLASMTLSKYRTVPRLFSKDEDSFKVPTISSAAYNLSFNEADSSSSDEDESPPSSPTEDQNGPDLVVCNNRNFMGVHILPGIPEEEEDEIEEENKKYNNLHKNIKRLSTISNQFEDLIASTEDKNGNFVILEPASLENKDAAKYVFLKASNSKSFPWICDCNLSYQKYLFKKRSRHVTDFLSENFLKPFYSSLTCLKFYPVVITKVITTLLSTMFVVSSPYISIMYSHEDLIKVISSENALLLTLTALPWLCFLVFLPYLMNASKLKLKIIFVFGLVCYAASSFLMGLQFNHDVTTLICLLFGLGFGMTSFTEDVVFKAAIGVRNWRRIEGSLDTLTGFFVIFLYFIICKAKLEVVDVLATSYFVYLSVVLMWILLLSSKLIGSCFKSDSIDDQIFANYI